MSLASPKMSAQQPVDGRANLSAQTTVPAASPLRGPVSGSVTDPLLLTRNFAKPTIARIGPGDELDITVFGLPELSQHVRVSSSGDVSLPLVGYQHLAGLWSDAAQTLIEEHLADGHFVNNPHVTVYVKEYTAEGIFLMGEVSRPGVYSPVGARLLDLLGTAGGVTDKAGRVVTIVHADKVEHPITLTLSDDATKTPEENIDLVPGDTVVVSKAGIVYVLGEVNRPGGFVMQDGEISASRVLAMAAGPTHQAALDAAKVIRHTSAGLKNIPLPLKKVLGAKIPDVQLMPDDIVWIPSSKAKGFASSSTGTILGLIGTLAIYHLP